MFSLVCTFFKPEALELFSPSINKESIKKILNPRFYLFGGIVICTSLLVHYHLYWAPAQLAKVWGKGPALESEAGYALYNLPYLYYLPYSIINFIVVGISTIAISLYAIYRDITKLSRVKKYFNKELKKVKLFIRSESGKNLFKDIYSHKVEREFERFCQRLAVTLDRYTFLFLVCAVGLAFEVLFGRSTLAETSLNWITGAYFFLAVVAIGMLLSYSYHEGGLNQSVELLLNLDYKEIGRFQTKNSSINFLQKRLRNSIYINLSILIIVITFVTYLLMQILSNS